MIIRLARNAELPSLAALDALRDADLTPGRVWVAVDEDDVLLGVLLLRLCWQAEPLVVMPHANKTTKSRASLMLYLAAEDWIADPLRNRAGPRWLFAVTRSPAVKAWSARLGWRRIYSRAAMFVKHLPPPSL